MLRAKREGRITYYHPAALLPKVLPDLCPWHELPRVYSIPTPQGP